MARQQLCQRAEEELCLLVQIETGSALDSLEAIASVDGVNGVFVGPADLAASLGFAGESGHPAVKAAIEDAIGRLQAISKPAGILTLDPAFAKKCIELGTLFIAVGVDDGILTLGADALAERFGGR